MTFKTLYIEDNPDIDSYEVARRIHTSRKNDLHSVTMKAIVVNPLAGDVEKDLE